MVFTRLGNLVVVLNDLALITADVESVIALSSYKVDVSFGSDPSSVYLITPVLEVLVIETLIVLLWYPAGILNKGISS